MARHSIHDGKDNMVKYEEHEDDEDEDDEDDGGIDDDIESIRRACMIAGANPDNIIPPSDDFGGGDNSNPSDYVDVYGGGGGEYWNSDGEDDLEIIRSIRSQFGLSVDVCETMKQLSALPLEGISDDDADEEEAFETLRVIRRRFSAYESSDAGGDITDDVSGKQQKVLASGITSDNEISSEILSRSNTCESHPDHQQSCVTVSHLEELQTELLDQPDTCGSLLLPAGCSKLPEFAHAYVDAIRRNRSYQRFLREKLTAIEKTIEQNNKLREEVKVFKDCQAYCKKIAGQALSQKMDHRVQLISTRKSGPSSSEGNDKKPSPLVFGPLENPRVENYRMALAKYALQVDRRKWTAEENENLAKGLRQQIHDRLLSQAIDHSSNLKGSRDDLDSIVQRIQDLEVTPEMIRQFLPKVNWDQLASRYLKHRSGVECEARWMNWEDPLVNQSQWEAKEDKRLMKIIQEKGTKDWVGIAVSLGTNRTPFQCLARYQRSLNASILRREWTKEDDEQLRAAVDAIGEKDWQAVASLVEGRTGTQCSNRWKKSLHPTRKKVGRWSPDEDRRLTVAVTLFGAKNWHKIVQYVPGRTPPQCRERWVNSLDPNVKRGPWSEEEDAKLRAAVAEHGHCWSRVATCVPFRTDNSCWRRWKTLYPHQVPLMQEARKLQRETFVGNFVDRESERPALLLPQLSTLPLLPLNPESELTTKAPPKKRKRRQKPGSVDDDGYRGEEKSSRLKRSRRGRERGEDENACKDSSNLKRKVAAKRFLERMKASE